MLCQNHVADKCWDGNLDPEPRDSRALSLSPHIPALPEEAHEDILERKSNHVLGDKLALGPQSVFPILGPLPP